jgi:hypothetical protein
MLLLSLKGSLVTHFLYLIQGNRVKGATINLSAHFSTRPVENAPQAAESARIGRLVASDSVHPIALVPDCPAVSTVQGGRVGTIRLLPPLHGRGQRPFPIAGMVAASCPRL